jgi:uncharacterized protein YcfL
MSKLRRFEGTLLAAAVLVLMAGCAAKRGPYVPYSHPPAVENQETVVLLSEDLVTRVGLEGELVRRLPDGRLEVTANVRNLTKYPLHVQAQTVFKDQDWFSTGDQSAWYDLLLNENETKSYNSVSMNDKAENYTIRIRRLVRPKPMGSN